jgi:outer membrane protein assembly factor BamD (BamD/ComL family)
MRKALLLIIIIAAVIGGYVYFVRMKGEIKVGREGVETKKDKFEMTADELYAAGNFAFNGTQYDKMFEYYELALKKDPNNPAAEDAITQAARVYENKLDFKRAYYYYNLYLQTFPNGRYRDEVEKSVLRTELRGGKN